jgi:hypothetical protein
MGIAKSLASTARVATEGIGPIDHAFATYFDAIRTGSVWHCRNQVPTLVSFNAHASEWLQSSVTQPATAAAHEEAWRKFLQVLPRVSQYNLPTELVEGELENRAALAAIREIGGWRACMAMRLVDIERLADRFAQSFAAHMAEARQAAK